MTATHTQRILRTIQYNNEIIPYYRTINGNVILITEPRPADDENAIFNLIQQSNKKQNKNTQRPR